MISRFILDYLLKRIVEHVIRILFKLVKIPQWKDTLMLDSKRRTYRGGLLRTVRRTIEKFHEWSPPLMGAVSSQHLRQPWLFNRSLCAVLILIITPVSLQWYHNKRLYSRLQSGTRNSDMNTKGLVSKLPK